MTVAGTLAGLGTATWVHVESAQWPLLKEASASLFGLRGVLNHIPARLRTSFTDRNGHRALAGHDLGRRGAELATVVARPERVQMFLLAGCDQVGAMGGAILTFAHAIGARLGALLSNAAGLVGGLARPYQQSKSDQGQHTRQSLHGWFSFRDGGSRC